MSRNQTTAPVGPVHSWRNNDVPEYPRNNFAMINRMLDAHGNLVATSAQDYAVLIEARDGIEGLPLSQGAGHTGLRSHSSQDSIGSAPSLAGSDTTLSETEVIDDEEVSVRQAYALPSASSSRASTSRSSKSTSSPSTRSSRDHSSASREITNDHWLDYEIDLPGATDPFAGMSAAHLEDEVIVAPGTNLPDAKTDLLAGVGAQFA